MSTPSDTSVNNHSTDVLKGQTEYAIPDCEHSNQEENAMLALEAAWPILYYYSYPDKCPRRHSYTQAGLQLINQFLDDPNATNADLWRTLVLFRNNHLRHQVKAGGKDIVTEGQVIHFDQKHVAAAEKAVGRFHRVSMIHHKTIPTKVIVYINSVSKPYGVSPERRVLSRGLFLKRFDYVRDCLKHALGLTACQREVVLRLLRFWVYYGQVYAKEWQITEDPGCSKATFWRTIRLLESLGLMTVSNRFILREHAQVSNLYRFDKLLIAIARYLAEHGTPFLEKWLEPFLTMTGRDFWHEFIWGGDANLTIPTWTSG